MNAEKLSDVLREMGRDVYEAGFETYRKEDVSELLLVLARVVEGKPLERAFGSPGDWGYSTPIGKALAAPQKTNDAGTARQ